MTAQTSLFDRPSPAQAERQAKDEGMAYAEAGMARQGYGPEDLEEMRRWARWFCHANRARAVMPLFEQARLVHVDNVVWADPVREHFNIRPMSGRGNNWIGNLFKEGFEPTGERISSTTPGSHSNDIRTWRVKKEAA